MKPRYQTVVIPGVGECVAERGGYTPIERYDATHQNRPAISASDVEQDISNASLGAQKITGLDTPCRLRVHSKRLRTTGDVDGISAKAAIDGIVHAGVLQDDSPDFIKEVSFTQEKVKKGEPECTIFDLYFE